VTNQLNSKLNNCQLFLFLTFNTTILDKEQVDPFILNALKEDVGDGDHTSLATILPGTQGKARLIVKDTGILAGVELAVEICRIIDPELKLELFLQDGAAVKYGDIAFNVAGSVHSILKAERLILNCMQRMSGIATRTNQIVSMLKGTGTKVLDTRKTTPGVRYLEKWAVKIGGGVNHRFGLYDMILIKDNHVDYSGGISNAINNAHTYLREQNKDLQIEIEVRNLEELEQVLQVGGVDRILLDNFKPQVLQQAIAMNEGRYITEASGGITVDNIMDYANAGVDYISVGALTHSVNSLDLSLKAIKE
jgi:nicotinate-nucleotide pyrophosphorylase (carboxylating)